MNTVDLSAAESAAEQPQAPPEQHGDNAALIAPKISGFERTNRSMFREPSLYLSLAVILVISIVNLNRTPLLFWGSLISMSTLALGFHMAAERMLFKSKKENEPFSAPFEGVFVLTFGSIIPGLGLLAYGAYSICLSGTTHLVEDLTKLAILMAVPTFNFLVWSGVKRRYLKRPRLTGLMNGLSFGLSIAWTVIWLKCLLFRGDTTCKFGWMLLLCTSPFLLFASACLAFDLWYKTESNIRRTATTFSILGGLLALAFVSMPMVHVSAVQSLLEKARNDASATQLKAISELREIASEEELRSISTDINGYTLSKLLVADRTLKSGSDRDRAVYFRVTGKSYPAPDSDASARETGSLPIASANISGLTLAKSQVTGQINATTMSSSLDWTMTFHNSSPAPQEARGEILIPKGAVVSQVTLWIDGVPRSGAFAPTSTVRAAYESVVQAKRDPLLVTMTAPDRVLLQCFPVPGLGGEMKVRIGIAAPLQSVDGMTASLTMPKFANANFTQPRRHKLNLRSSDALVHPVAGIAQNHLSKSYSLQGIIKAGPASDLATITVQRSNPLVAFAAPEENSRGRRFVLNELQYITNPAPKRLFVVIDSSTSLQRHANKIKAALSEITSEYEPKFFVVEPPTARDEMYIEAPVVALDLNAATKALSPSLFVGGKNNERTLGDVLETAAERPDSAVLWIHGPQPFDTRDPNSGALELMYGVCLYDLQLEPGPVGTLTTLQSRDISHMLTTIPVQHRDVADDITNLLAGWKSGAKTLTVKRTSTRTLGAVPVFTDAEAIAQLNSLWARDRVEQLLAEEQDRSAVQLASASHIITPVTGAVVLESQKEYDKWRLNPSSKEPIVSWRMPIDMDSMNDTYRGMHQWFNDDLAGNLFVQIQSMAVGHLVGYGYDTARDVSRLATLLSFLLSLVLSAMFVWSRKRLTPFVVLKAIGLVLLVPSVVQITGTILINNFGGLGGGL